MYIFKPVIVIGFNPVVVKRLVLHKGYAVMTSATIIEHKINVTHMLNHSRYAAVVKVEVLSESRSADLDFPL